MTWTDNSHCCSYQFGIWESIDPGNAHLEESWAESVQLHDPQVVAEAIISH